MDQSTQYLEENLENVRLYNTYVLGKKLFIFPVTMKFETYQNKWYYGITFIIEGDGDGVINKDGKYDVVHHYHMEWERMNISNRKGWIDMPFHAGTYRFLPDEVKVLEL